MIEILVERHPVYTRSNQHKVTLHFYDITGHARQGQGRSEEGYMREDTKEQTLWRRILLAVQTLDVKDGPSCPECEEPG